MTGGHVLVVEDERKIAELLRDYLRQEGFTVTCLDRGDLVAPEVRRRVPAMILLDIMLPGLDGIEVCREIRKFSQVPIIMITARVEEIDRLLGLELGADDYVCKPFSPREVVARVKAVLRRVNPQPLETILVAGPLRLDGDTRMVSVDGEEVSLTPNEFGILKALMARPNRVFSRSELIDLVQGYSFEGYERTIDTHIKNLRKKIAERLPENDVISTVYGVGYRLAIEPKS